MPSKAIFDLFEVLCLELAGKAGPKVIDETNLRDANLVAELKKATRETDGARAFEQGLAAIVAHFAEREAALPFDFDLPTRRFTAKDQEYLEFIASAQSIRGSGAVSKKFEEDTLHRLRKRLPGSLRRVGHPRGRLKKKKQFLGYLRTLGFDKNALEARSKDGGFDILWLPPLGAVPLRPIVSFQCKNSSFDEKDAGASVAKSESTFSRHSHLRKCGTMHLVVFNDYIAHRDFVGRATGWIFLPLGLSDLAMRATPDHHDVL